VQVNRLTLRLAVTSAVPQSTRVSVIGDNVTWTVFINKNCTDTFYHWTSYSELTNCVVYVNGRFCLFDSPEYRYQDHAQIDLFCGTMSTGENSVFVFFRRFVFTHKAMWMILMLVH